MKKMLLLLLLFVTILFVYSCEQQKQFNDEYFIYEISGGGTRYMLVGLTEKGKNLEYLVLPTTYNNLPVETSAPGWTWRFIFTENDGAKTKRIFIPYDIYAWYVQSFVDCPQDCKIIYLGADYVNANRSDNFYITYLGYVYGNTYLNFKDIDKLLKSSEGSFPWPANVAYFFNYEDAPNNGYYFSDDYDGELIGYKPINPIREGYKFAGWYKESECINEWNFESDIVPKKITNEDGVYQYHETILYAKWIEE